MNTEGCPDIRAAFAFYFPGHFIVTTPGFPSIGLFIHFRTTVAGFPECSLHPKGWI